MLRMGQFALVFLFFVLFPLTPAIGQENQDDTRRPNILLVLFDDVGFMGFGAYGSDARTPNIDRLAQKGIMLSRYYTSPFCGPSRAMLMTGMDNHQVGMGTLVETVTEEMRVTPGYSMTWDARQKTIGTLLSQAGYQTYVTGKWGIGEIGANLPNKFGFDRSYVMDATGGGNYDAKPYLPGSHAVRWFEDGQPVELADEHYSSKTLVDKLIGYIADGDAKKPFFGYLSLQALHMPIQVPVEYTDRYNGVFDAGWDVKRQERLQKAIALGLVPKDTKLAPPPASHRAWDDLTPEEKAVSAREMQVNAGMMEAADFHIGRLLTFLEEAGKLDNTIVIVASDNGAESAMTSFSGLADLALDAVKWIEGFDTSFENLGQPKSLTAIGPEWASVSSAPFSLYKFYASEGGLRVPLVVAGPGIAADGIEDAPVHVADLVPTMLDAAGISFDPADFYGQSAYPLLSGKSGTTYGADQNFAFEVSGNAALYRGQWKITRNTPPRGDNQWRLFDLSVDPGETTDVSAENPTLFKEMIAEYQSYSQNVGVFDLASGDYAVKILNEKLINKSLHKYRFHIFGTVIFVVLLLLGIGFLVRRVVRGHLGHAKAS